MNDRRKSANDFQRQNQAKRPKNTYKSFPFSPFQTLKPACFLAFEVERLIVAKMLQTDRKRPLSQISIMCPEVRVFFRLNGYAFFDLAAISYCSSYPENMLTAS